MFSEMFLVNTKYTNLTATQDGKCVTISHLVHYVQSYREAPKNIKNLPKIGEVPKEWKSFHLVQDMKVYILTYVGYSRFVESVIVKVCHNHCVVKDFGEVTLKCIYPFNFHLFERNCKRAIEMWLRARLFYKDLRKLIASYIWETREEVIWREFRRNSLQITQIQKT
jgi:hypothetical protein